MIILIADVVCDGWFYTTPTGDKIERCKRSFLAPIDFESPRTSLRKEVKRKGWWRDPKSHNSYPKNVCPECRKKMLGI